MKRLLNKGAWLLAALTLAACTLSAQDGELQGEATIDRGDVATATITPDRALEIALLQTGEPLPTVTDFPTLRPPPTDEPPTPTPTATTQPTETPFPTIDVDIGDLGLGGLNTETPRPGEGVPCAPREDWALFYEVQIGDALANIAPRYNTSVEELAEGNCISDPSLIRIGQTLRVPGSAHPLTPEFICEPWELLAPFNGTITVPGSGLLNFTWRGPESPRYLLRIYTQNADGTFNQVYEQMVEFKQNTSVDLADIPDEGLYLWQVFPIGNDFLQIPCQESFVSQFVKAPEPTPIPGLPDDPGASGSGGM